MKLQHLLVILGITLTSTACSNWIYRIDVPQGNFLDQRDVDKLRVGMTKEQVIYVLGNPVVQDSFDDDTWYYVYDMKRGMKKRGEDFQKQMIINFVDNKVTTVEGDFELSEDFNTPLDN
ncbi:outer membrane protein assembly factor BamE [Alteromonas gracilis]|uniref:outer membrane protein assembly factor BamE n=1 Tax=Alteromonas gracilis TaxID=1479524 RepID=UPI003736E714